MSQIYADKKYIKYLTSITDKHYKEQEPVIECVPNGIIANEHIKGYGVFDKNFKFVKSSIQKHKGHKGQFVPQFNHDNLPYVDEDVVYLAHCGKNNFGHFLLEHINRGWCFLDKKYQKMKVVIVNEIDCKKINDYIYVLLGLLGVKKENIILLNETTQFKNVYIPTPGFDLTAFYTQKYVDMYDKIADAVTGTDVYEKIYLSKCKMPVLGQVHGEAHIQSIFEKNGYKIIYPETLPLTEQIWLARNAKVLAGCGGTALHLALFMKPGGKVIQIKRNRVLKDNADTQHLINMAKKLDSVFIAGSIETVKTPHFSHMPQIISVTKYMKQFFDDNDIKYSQEDIKLPDDVLDAYVKELGSMNSGKSFMKSVKKSFIHYTSCFLPGRMMRKKYRHFMQRILKMD